MSALRDVDLSGLDAGTVAALEEVARLEWTLEALRAQREQDQLAAEIHRMGGFNAVDGLGAVRRNIDAFAFHDWARKEKTYDCWRDKSFNRYIDRIAPETKARCTGTRLQVGWTPPTNFAVSFHRENAPRFAKTYQPADKPRD